jgi:ferric-dicitrate binding protein FerR (iron transport regulator)
MDAKDKYTKLLSNEDFQDDIRNFPGFSKEEQIAVLQKYSITEKDFTYARRLFDGVSFDLEKLNPADVILARQRLMMRIKNTSSHQQRAKNRKIGFVTWISRVAAVLSVPLLLSTIYFYQKSASSNSNGILSSTEKTRNTFQAPPGAKTQVALPDGSMVWLNSGSSLSCPTRFGPDSREVTLKGEAYFEVVKNEQAPMLVSTGNLKVKVYGTKFNVNAFADDGLVKTTLVEGKVTLIPGNSKKEYALGQGYTAFYDIKDQKIQAAKVEKMDAFTGWKDGKLLLHNERFADIVNRLERWYNVDIQLYDPSLGDYTLYATFMDENIEQVLDIFSSSIPITVDYPKRKKQADGSYSKRKIVIKRDADKKTD